MAIQAAAERARRLLHRGDHAAAIEVWRDILSEDPLLAFAHAGLAGALFAARRMTAASAEARQALGLDPECTEAMLVLALTGYFEGHTDKALKRLDHLLGVDPLSVDAMVLKAQILRVEGRHAEARAAIDSALELAPLSSDALIERGWLARDTRDRDTVARIAADLITRDPDHLPSLVLLGHARRDAGDRAAARDLALQALAIDPMDQPALNLFASVKLAENPVGGMFWHIIRYLATMRESRRLLLVALVYFLYLATLSTFDWFGLPEPLSWLFVALYLFLGLGLYLNEQIIRWLVDRELRKVALHPNY